MTYKPSQSFSTRATPQTERTPGRTDEVQNSAGGYTFSVRPEDRLDRFLILGAEGGTYYASERKLTRENAQVVLDLIKLGRGPWLVEHVAEVSESGRAPKNEPALFALAIALKLGDDATRAAAGRAVPRVARTGTHLLHLAEMVNGLGGWGRGTRRAFGGWFTGRSARDLAYQAIKYQQRDGWSLRDVLRLAHPKMTGEHAEVARWIVSGQLPEQPRAYGPGIPPEGVPAPYPGPGTALIAVRNRLHDAAARVDTRDVVDAIRLAGLPREAIPTGFLKDPKVWDALLHAGKSGMPLGALVRNLATMTRVGLLAPGSAGTAEVVRRLGDDAGLTAARVHPVALLAALLTYRAGRSARGDSTWTPVPQVVDALDRAFYGAFPHTPAAGARFLLGIDVSASMDGGVIAGVPGLTPRFGAAAMAMVTAAREASFQAVGFTSASGRSWTSGTALTPLDISPRRRLDDVVNYMRGIPFGGTDVSLPMLYAADRGIPVDTFVVYTDNETWAGSMKPHQALRRYREKMGIPARLVVVGMTATEFTVADPTDRGMLDVVGFDTAAPSIITDFAREGLTSRTP